MQNETVATNGKATSGEQPHQDVQRRMAAAVRKVEGSTRRTIGRGQFISELGRVPTGICLIESGIVIQTINNGDKRLVMGFTGQGDLLYAGRLLAHTPGDPAAFLDRSTWAMMEVRTIEVPWNVARRIPELVSMAGELNERERLTLERQLFAAHYSSVQARLATLIIKLREQFGVPQQGGRVLVGLPITHQQIADAIGSTRETVTLTLGELKKKKLITFDKRHVVVLNMDGLRTLAGT